MADQSDNNYDPLEVFLDRLIEEKGFAGVEPEVLIEVKNDLRVRAEDRINASILASLPPDKLEEFERLLDGATDEEIQQFCQSNIADYDQVVAAALVGFRDTYLNA